MLQRPGKHCSLEVLAKRFSTLEVAKVRVNFMKRWRCQITVSAHFEWRIYHKPLISSLTCYLMTAFYCPLHASVYYINWRALKNHHWEKPSLHTWQITKNFFFADTSLADSTMNDLIAPWINTNAFSFWNVNKVDFFLIVWRLYNIYLQLSPDSGGYIPRRETSRYIPTALHRPWGG